MASPHPERPWMPGYEVAPGTTGLLSWEWAERRLVDARRYWLATVHPAGRPHLMAVWAIWWEGRLWFSTGGRSRKSLNLEADARCSVSSERADEAVIIEGTAERITDDPTLQRLVVVYADKYGRRRTSRSTPYHPTGPLASSTTRQPLARWLRAGASPSPSDKQRTRAQHDRSGGGAAAAD